MIELYNEDCFKTMRLLDDNSVNIVLTSPFYNTNKKAGKTLTLKNTTFKPGQYSYIRYDSHVDNMSNAEYNDYSVKLFNEFNRIISKNGCVLYNISYGSENTNGMFEAVNAIITRTNWDIADVIIWKKPSVMPNNVSKNRLTRTCEFVFVFCRTDEQRTFFCNKQVLSYRKSGQAIYENLFNFIEAKNNDGANPYNKATFSSELCEKLLTLYAQNNCVVYDPFMGTGTTAVACERMGFDCIGSEISKNQVLYSVERLQSEFNYLKNNEDKLYYEVQQGEN